MFIPGLIIDRSVLLRSRVLSAPRAPVPYVPPRHLDRRPEVLATNDQGTTPRCAAYAMAGCLEYWDWKRGNGEQKDPDAIYRRAKEIDGFPDEQGTTLEAVIKASADLGLAPIDTNSLRVIWPKDMKWALHRYGVLLTAFTVGTNWIQAQPDGWIPPGGDYLGMHAVMLIGYSEEEDPPWWGFQNSWGETHGWRGFNRMSPELFDEEVVCSIVWEMK